MFFNNTNKINKYLKKYRIFVSLIGDFYIGLLCNTHETYLTKNKTQLSLNATS